MSSPSFQRPPEVPPEITFISLPTTIAQFHHLPVHVPVWIHRQEEVKEKGYNFQEGVRVMEALLEEAPGIPGAYLYQLFVRKWPKLMDINPYFQSGRIAEAIPKLVEILEIDPECPLTCFQLGYCFRVTGELEKSESFYKQSLRMAPEAGWIYSNLARTYRVMGERSKAVEAFWKALELMPGDHFVLEQLMEMGEVFAIPHKSGKKGEAAVAFVKRADYEKKMREILGKEKDPAGLVKLAWKALQDRLFEPACEAFEKALEQRPDLTEALLGLGTAHLESGRLREAERFLGEYLEDNPESAAGHLNLFKVYLAQEEMDLAWDEIQAAVRLDPGRLDALRQLYFLFRQTDRKEEGLSFLDQLAADHPQSYAALLVKAQALCEDSKWPEAQDSLEQALRRAPGQEEVLLVYTAELGKRGKREELIALLNSQTGPLPLSLVINLALAYSQTDRIEKGKEALERFLERPGLNPLDEERARGLLRELEK